MAGYKDFFNWYHDNGILPNIWKGATGQLSQEKINEENLQYQRERNEIEDARYAEETAYNRAFAEDERDYNRAFAEDERNYQRDWAANEREYQRNLQQTIFDREDTAIARQAEALRAQGINPASQNMNGLGAGSVVSSSTPGNSSSPGSMSAPALSGRGGQALQKAMITSTGINGLLAPILQTLNTIDTMKGNGIQRDVLNAQAVKTQAEANMAMMNMFDTADRLNMQNNSFYYGVNKNKHYQFNVNQDHYNPYNFTPKMLNDLEGKTKVHQYASIGYDNKIKKIDAKKFDSVEDTMRYLTAKLMDNGSDKLLDTFSGTIEKLLFKAFK